MIDNTHITMYLMCKSYVLFTYRWLVQLSQFTFPDLVFYGVKALCYKPEGRGFDSRWGEFLNLSNPSGRTRLWGLLSLYQ
jgi:hypothetical protein